MVGWLGGEGGSSNLRHFFLSFDGGFWAGGEAEFLSRLYDREIIARFDVSTSLGLEGSSGLMLDSIVSHIDCRVLRIEPTHCPNPKLKRT